MVNTFTESQKYDIRYSTLEDMEYLSKFLNTEGMLHYFLPSDHQELDNFVRIWIGFARYNASLTATYENIPIAIGTLFLMPYRKVAHHSQFQLIVDPNFHRMGVGTSLVRNLKHLAKNTFRLEALDVEIFDETPMIPLLEKLGFTIFGRQEGYVKEGSNYFPRILMGCEL